jgi:uncharacterized delta-60 repeat protein
MSVGLVIRPNGVALVAAGTLEPDCGSRFALARLREGRLDRRFGTGGRVLTRFGSRSAVAIAMGAMPDGRVVLAGELKAPDPSSSTASIHAPISISAVLPVSRSPAITRTGGWTGPSAGTAGFSTTSTWQARLTSLSSPTGRSSSLARAPTVWCSSATTAAAAATLLSEATGRYSATLAASSGRAALDGAGRIRVSDSPSCAPCPASVVRFTRDGRLDPTFGRDGRAFLPTRSAQLHAVAVAGGQIIAAGVEGLSRRRLVVARFLSNGALDLSFGRGGLAALRAPRITFVNDLAIQRDGRIVVLTTRFPFMPPRGPVDFRLTRLPPSGSVDRAFGAAGTATADFGFSDVGEAVAIQPDGKLVVAGVIDDRPGLYRADALGVARYLP